MINDHFIKVTFMYVTVQCKKKTYSHNYILTYQGTSERKNLLENSWEYFEIFPKVLPPSQRKLLGKN